MTPVVSAAGSIVIVAMTVTYYVLFIITIWRARRQLKHKPFSQLRAANILMHLQVGPCSGICAGLAQP